MLPVREARQETRRVVLVTTVHPAADARILWREARRLANAGYGVEVIGPPPGPKAPIGGVRLTLICRAKGRLRRVLFGGWRLVPLLVRQRAALYHIHDPELLPVGLPLRALGRRIADDAHEDLPQQIRDKEWIPKPARAPLAWLARIFLRATSHLLSGVVAATDGVASGFGGRVVVVRNYPDVSLFSPHEGSGEDRVSFVYVGGISFSRGLREMVAATERNDRVRLHLIGAVEGTAEADFLAGRAPSRVTVEPWMEPPDVYRRLGEADVGLALLHDVPRYREALPVKLFEYMAAGLPVIASDFPLWRGIVEGAGAGLLVDPRDPQAIAAAIDRLAADPELRRAMGQRARRAAVERYNWQSEAEALLRLYEEVIPHGRT